jgi:tetratricopeptide (TPR) repeat protein
MILSVFSAVYCIGMDFVGLHLLFQEIFMSEMLGNQYFLARNFEKALQHFESALKVDAGNEKVQKKLIICYCEIGNVPGALDLFEKVVSNHIELIVETDIISEDCPCLELVKRMRWYEEVAATSFDYHCILGILNLYCKIYDSIKYFSRASELQPDNRQIRKILTKIKKYTSDHAEI